MKNLFKTFKNTSFEQARLIYDRFEAGQELPQQQTETGGGLPNSPDGYAQRAGQFTGRALDRIDNPALKLASDLPPGANQEINAHNILNMQSGQEVVTESGRVYKKLQGAVYYNSQGPQDNTWGRIDEIGTTYVMYKDQPLKVRQVTYGFNSLAVPENGPKDVPSPIFDRMGKELPRADGDWYRISSMLGPQPVKYVNGQFVEAGNEQAEPEKKAYEVNVQPGMERFLGENGMTMDNNGIYGVYSNGSLADIKWNTDGDTVKVDIRMTFAPANQWEIVVTNKDGSQSKVRLYTNVIGR